MTDDPDTVELAAGAVRETEGGVVSGVETTVLLRAPPPPPSPPPNVSDGRAGSESGITDCEDVADGCAVELAATELAPWIVAAVLEGEALSADDALSSARVFGPTLPTASRPLCV